MVTCNVVFANNVYVCPDVIADDVVVVAGCGDISVALVALSGVCQRIDKSVRRKCGRFFK